MSLSETQRELLLSASLDDALSPEEQALLDQWLREDPAAQKQRDELATMNQQLRSALAPARRAKLDAGFADRVINAAIEQAVQENLAPSHPLVRLARAEQDHLAGSPDRRRHWRWAAAAVALAASLLLAVLIGRSPADTELPDGQTFAQIDHDNEQSDTGADPGRANMLAVAENDASTAAERDGSQRIAQSGDAAGTYRQDAESTTQSGDAPALDQVASNGRPSSSNQAAPTATDERQSVSGSAEMRPDMFSTDLAVRPETTTPSAASGAIDSAGTTPEMMPLSFVLVVSVEMTQAGRDSLALLEALRHADIRIGPAGIVSEQVVSHLEQSGLVESVDDEEPAKMYYIEAPAKQLDKFMLRLMADRDAVESFGLTLAENPPLLASVNDWRVFDPTKLRHSDIGAIARDLVSADGTPLGIDPGSAFVPVPRGLGVSGMLPVQAAAQSVADDIPSQILLLVH